MDVVRVTRPLWIKVAAVDGGPVRFDVALKPVIVKSANGSLAGVLYETTPVFPESTSVTVSSGVVPSSVIVTVSGPPPERSWAIPGLRRIRARQAGGGLADGLTSTAAGRDLHGGDPGCGASKEIE